jgi:uncharacterized integral membrane protein
MRRKISWALAAMAYLLPASLAIFALQATTSSMRANNGFVCALPLIGIMFWAAVAAALLSAFATAIGYGEFRKIAKPRSQQRWAELVILSLPFVLGVSLVLFIIVQA